MLRGYCFKTIKITLQFCTFLGISPGSSMFANQTVTESVVHRFRQKKSAYNCKHFRPIILAYVLGAQKNRLIETVILGSHNMWFGWEIRKLFFCYAPLTKGLQWVRTFKKDVTLHLNRWQLSGSWAATPFGVNLHFNSYQNSFSPKFIQCCLNISTCFCSCYSFIKYNRTELFWISWKIYIRVSSSSAATKFDVKSHLFFQWYNVSGDGKLSPFTLKVWCRRY